MIRSADRKDMTNVDTITKDAVPGVQDLIEQLLVSNAMYSAVFIVD